MEEPQQDTDENMNRRKTSSKPVQADDASFDAEVLESKKPVLVAFSALWSQSCKILAPILDEIASECSDRLKVVRVNADGNPDLGFWYNVQSIPTLLYFIDGSVHAKVVGTATKEAILSKLGLI